MKTLIMNIAIMASLLFGMIACSDADREIPAPVHKSGTVQLTLSGNKMISRATEAGVDELNENKINNADLFFFAAGRTNEIYIYHTANLTINSKTGEAVVNVPADALNFDGTQYDIYAIANASFTEQQLSNKTLDQLKQLPATDLGELVQSSFVMDGILKNVALVEDENCGTIELERAASKISLEITVVDEVVVGEGTDTETHYTPILSMEDNTSAMTVSMYKRVKNGLVNSPVSPQYLDADSRTISEGESGHIPFYSYPCNWSQNIDNEAYLSLKIQWRNENTGTTLPYIYRVPVNDDTKNLLRNNHYKIKLNVTILGSLDEETEVELEPEYVIENWSEEKIDTDMKKYQYLWVKDKKVVMNNVEEVEIEYASSSALSFQYKTVKRYYKGDISTAEQCKTVENGEKDKVYIEENEQKGTIVVKHKFQDSKDDEHQNYYRPWYITFSVYNEDGLHVDDIEVIQYPAVYIVADFNADYQSDKRTKNGNNNRFVNGSEKGKADNGKTLGGVTDITGGGSSATNKNRNQYMISISRLGSNDGNYIIGDPRVATSVAYNDLSGGTGRTLQFYYPTRTTGVNNMIAPAFRIASSWGVTSAISYEIAQKRCASYQENGYPAGRWRIPTEAEIKYIVNLSSNGYIPELFDGNYWASSQRYYQSKDKNFSPNKEGDISTSSHYVRCVYDTWYWGDKKIDNIYQFTWGDEIIK